MASGVKQATMFNAVVRPETAAVTDDARNASSVARALASSPSESSVTFIPHEDWDEYVRGHPEGTIFHTNAWRDVVKHTFGHQDHYLTALRHGRVAGVLPLFRVDSLLAGRMLVSVPYGVGGGTLADDDDVAADLFTAARKLAEDLGCRSIDLRSERAHVPELPVVDRYVGFQRELPDCAEDVLDWLPRKARAAARNARDKFQLTVDTGDEHLREVWRLYTISMRRLGSLAYPYRFFEQLVATTPREHSVSIVRRHGRPVTGLLTLLFRDRVLPYFIGTTDEAKKCSAANFIYLSAMERGVSEGYRVFDFGRSRRDNIGSFNFKRFHGFQPRSLEYQAYAPAGLAAPDLSPNRRAFAFARSLWKHLPLSVTQRLGARIAYHIPG